MKAYGKTLVNEEPDETTELLKKLCSDYKPVVDRPPERMIFFSNFFVFLKSILSKFI